MFANRAYERGDGFLSLERYESEDSMSSRQDLVYRVKFTTSSLAIQTKANTQLIVFIRIEFDRRLNTSYPNWRINLVQYIDREDASTPCRMPSPSHV